MAELEPIRPADEPELRDLVAAAAAHGTRLALKGGGSKRDIGGTSEAQLVDLRGFAGVVDYDPSELVLTVRPGTPLSEVQALVAAQKQMLAFDPFDHGPLFGREPGAATIGGVIAAGVSGSQALSAGRARDHLLGFRAVSGRGESFVAGAKVVKNVTGYDLCKLATGSWGRLFATTELTLKVLPAPHTRLSCAVAGLTPEQSVAVMSAAMGSQADVAAAAHLPTRSLTVLRLQGFEPSVAARRDLLARVLAPFGSMEVMDKADGDRVWQGLRSLVLLGDDTPLWRVSVPPSAGPLIIAAMANSAPRWIFDWAGGLVWLAGELDPNRLYQAATEALGHAMLVRGPADLRAAVPAFQPQSPMIARIESRIRRAFDPNGVFETTRFRDFRDED